MSKCGCYGRAKWRRGTVDPSKLVQGIKIAATRRFGTKN